jgi:hypothetical protein
MTAPGDVDVFRPDSSPQQYARDPADPQAIIELIEAVRSGDLDRTGHKDTMPAMDLLSFGDPLDDCGDDLPHFCRSCGSTFAIGRTCGRSQCPRCWAKWVLDRASAICGKLDALRRFKYAAECGPGPQQPDNMFYHHLVISPPPDWLVDAGESPLDVFERTLDLVKDLLDELGVEGVVFYHPYRGEDGDDLGEWKKRIGQNRPWTEYQGQQRDDLEGAPVRDELELSPHFHVIGVAPFVDGDGVTDVVSEATNWNIIRLTQSENSTKSITDDFSLARAVTYCLSHTGLYEADQTTQAAYRYVGSDINSVTAYDENQLRIDTIVRAVAPRTLGIPYRELACETDVIDRAEYNVDMDRAIGSSKGVDALARATSTSSSSDSSSDVEGLTVSNDEPQRSQCQGMLLPIHKARDFLDDPDWIEDAENADELLETWNRWASKPKNREYLERWLEKERQRWLEDWPPPD